MNEQVVERRDYQITLKQQTYDAWNSGKRNVLNVLATGGGKSVIMSDIVLDGAHANYTQCVIAHRNELVAQMSAHIGRRGIPHRIVGSDSTINQIRRQHRALFNGQQFVHPTARTSVVGVDTLIARKVDLERWAHQHDRWMLDEGHHCLGGKNPNKWGKAIAMMPNALGSGFTATPIRADGQGLGRDFDGVFDVMNIGPSMRWLIDSGYLCDYEIVCPSSDLQVGNDEVSANGDWSTQTLKKAAKKSRIVGDVVENYCRYAYGRRAIVFATDIETASDIAKKFIQYQIRAAALSAETPTAVREKYINEFKSGKISVLINVDLFDEGFDVPACDVVIQARPTASLGKYRQMCLDAQTEILTKRGWLKHHQMNYQDEVAAFNINDEKIEWCSVENIISRPLESSEEMYELKSPQLDIRVSCGHDMIVKSRSETSKNWMKQTAKKVAQRKSMFKIPVSSFDMTLDNETVRDDEIKFLGWFLTDGSHNKKSNQVTIWQSSSKIKHCNEIERVLKSCGFKYGIYRAKRQGLYSHHSDGLGFYISFGKPNKNNKHLRGWSDLEEWIDKSFPEIYETLSHRQMNILLEAMNLGDGRNQHVPKDYVRSTISLTCGNDEYFADRLQSLCVRKGFRCSKSIHYYNKSPLYNLQIKKVNHCTIAGGNVPDNVISGRKYIRSRFEKSSHVEGELIWCVTNRLGSLITRRNGKVAIVGNCGRGLRFIPGKTALIIDMVSNWLRHGLPDKDIVWSLARRDKRGKQVKDPDEIPLTDCKNIACRKPYERFRVVCPYCGAEKPLPEPRSRTIEMVEGDLMLLDRAMLEKMRQGTILETPGSIAERVALAAGQYAGMAAAKRQGEKIEAHAHLCETLAQWAGIERSRGFSDREIQRKFYYVTGMDVVTALDATRPRSEMDSLNQTIQGWWRK